jgi:hypothetical protein
MVEAILDGRKTQTRRIIKQNPKGVPCGICTSTTVSSDDIGKYGFALGDKVEHLIKCPYGQPGDILWVRETWAEGCMGGFIYAAGRTAAELKDYSHGYKWRPSIYMPREAARIFLQITNVHVHRLHDITTSQIKAEGVRIPVNHRGTPEQTVVLDIHGKDKALSFLPAGTLSGEYKPTQDQWMMAHWAELWCSINGRDSWDANPWVWAIEFQRVEA